MKNCRQMKAMIQKLHSFEVQKIGQILFVKRYLFTNPFTVFLTSLEKWYAWNALMFGVFRIPTSWFLKWLTSTLKN